MATEHSAFTTYIYKPLWAMGRRFMEVIDGGATESQVREHIDQLLGLPEELKRGLSQADYHAFTLSNPAPALAVSTTRASLLVTIELDSLAAGSALVKLGFRPAVLNMANAKNCGGAWTSIKGSQEESLFRRSSLPLSLWPHRGADDNRISDVMSPRDDCFYPISEAGVLYSPRVLVTRDERSILLAESDRFEVAVVSVAAQDLRVHTPGGTTFDEVLTREKMRSLLHVAAAQGHDTVVLGALGAGAFKNDPREIAVLFSKLLDEDFAGHFRVVVFAIILSTVNIEAFAAHFPLVPGATAHERSTALQAMIQR